MSMSMSMLVLFGVVDRVMDLTVVNIIVRELLLGLVDAGNELGDGPEGPDGLTDPVMSLRAEDSLRHPVRSLCCVTAQGLHAGGETRSDVLTDHVVNMSGALLHHRLGCPPNLSHGRHTGVTEVDGGLHQGGDHLAAHRPHRPHTAVQPRPHSP